MDENILWISLMITVPLFRTPVLPLMLAIGLVKYEMLTMGIPIVRAMSRSNKYLSL